MNKYQYTPEASQDLESIVEFIAEDNPTAAGRVAASIERKCQAIAEIPGIGRERNELAPGLRSSLAGSYVILYRPVDDGIQVIRIVHGHRDIRKLFE